MPLKFWLLCLIASIERLAFWAALIQLPIYISQKDAVGGLHWEQSLKGIIFFFWAIVQNLTPVITGGLADKINPKKVLAIAISVIILGYIFISFSKSPLLFILSALLLGFGSGLFKPALQGTLAKQTNEANSSLAWGIYTTFVNLGIFVLGAGFIALAKSFSWQGLFIGCGIISALNFLLLFSFQNDKKSRSQSDSLIDSKAKIFDFKIMKDSIIALKNPDIYLFLISMSGFTIIYMQFYETLPNFISDWSNLDYIFGIRNPSIEWLYALCSGLIVGGVAIISWSFSGLRRIKVIILGIIAVTSGVMIIGLSRSGELLIIGMVIYTIGEMITNPKFNDYMASKATDGRKAQYLGLLNISWAIGLSGGSLIGGYLYGMIGEKSGLAAKYLIENNMINYRLIGKEAFNKLTEITGLSHSDAANLLWKQYNPWLFWLIIAFIGLASLVALYFYSKKYNRDIRYD